MTVNPWSIAVGVYIVFAVVSLIPFVVVSLKGVKPNDAGPSFEDNPILKPVAKQRLQQHFDRMRGTLGFWKREGTRYRLLHNYCVVWTLPFSVLIPLLSQITTTDPASRLLLTLVSVHAALCLAFHKGLKVEQNFRAFRLGESEFYDIYRRFLDQPSAFGDTEDKQLQRYFEEAEGIRKAVRNAETDNIPAVVESSQRRGSGT